MLTTIGTRYRRGGPALSVGAAIVLIMALLALFGPLVVRQDPQHEDFHYLLSPPGGPYLLGTDDLGRSILARVIYGARVSLAISGLSTAAAVLVGAPVGLVAGYQQGWIDAVAMRLTDGVLAFPGVLLALLLIATLGASSSSVVVALGISFAPLFARTIRASTLVEREKEYITAAMASGGSVAHILRRHIVPNVADTLLVQATLCLGLCVLSEATLSYLGLSAAPEVPSWGRMVFEGQRLLELTPFVSLMPLLAISVTILGFNLLGNGLSDALNSNRQAWRGTR